MKEGWEIKKLGELCNLMTGGTPSRSKKEYFEGGTIKWLVSGDIHKKEIFDCEGRISELGMANSNAKFLPVDSVMIALNGQGKTRGTVALLRTHATCNQSLVSIYPKDKRKVLPEFIFCNLHGRYEEIRKITGDDDNDRRGLNMPLIRNIEIPLPPLPEQQRIVSILDEAFAAIAKVKANAEQNLKNAKELFESYLQGVFENGDWEKKKLGEVCTIGDGNYSSKYPKASEFVKSGIPFLTASNLKNGTVIPDGIRFISKEQHLTLTKGHIIQGDLVIVVRGSSTGNNSIIPKEFDGSNLNSQLAFLRVKNKNYLDNDYLFSVFNSQLVMKKVKAEISGAAQPQLPNNKLLDISINIPSLQEQHTIVRQLDALRAETQKLEALYQQKIADLEELKKSILQKAFAGELTGREVEV